MCLEVWLDTLTGVTYLYRNAGHSGCFLPLTYDDGTPVAIPPDDFAKKRFAKTYSQGSLESIEVWVDLFSGINYIFRYAKYGGNFIPMLDAAGKYVVTPPEQLKYLD